MGSDSMQKSSYGLKEAASLKIRTYGIALLSLSFIIFLYYMSHFSGGVYTSSSSSNASSSRINDNIPESEITLSKSSIPERCHATLDKLIQCQKQSSSSNNKETIVFACHRKWCNSFYGHCETVNGIGDRTKHMLSMVSDASIDRCLRIELDYPQGKHGIELRFADFEYHDPWGIIAELFHFRSYDVSDLKVDVNSWGKKREKSSKSLTTRRSGGTSQVENNGKTFVHFIPSQDQYQFHKYDPCLYHILFKTTSILDTEIQYYSDLIKLHDENVIGMHFRTGDLTAFGLENKDIRTRSDRLIQSYDLMMSCALAHAKKLGIQPQNNPNDIIHNKGSVGEHNVKNNDAPSNQKIKIFLATDNQIIKEKARNDKRFSIYMTEDKPTAYIRSEGDRSAYTDLYLLSKTRGLVVNELPNTYDGPAEKVSTFAQLAMTIGFMDDSQLHRCKLD